MGLFRSVSPVTPKSSVPLQTDSKYYAQSPQGTNVLRSDCFCNLLAQTGLRETGGSVPTYVRFGSDGLADSLQ